MSTPAKRPQTMPVIEPYIYPYEKMIISSRLGNVCKKPHSGKTLVCIRNAAKTKAKYIIILFTAVLIFKAYSSVFTRPISVLSVVMIRTSFILSKSATGISFPDFVRC